MEVKTYPNARDIERIVVGRHTAHLADVLEGMTQRMMAATMQMELIAIERDGASVERVEDVVTSIIASFAIAVAAANAKNACKQFDPQGFGRFITDFGMMMLPTFQAIDESDTATKN
jgi:predicted SpoU family rRNA methylase